MATQRDNDPSADFPDGSLSRAESGSDLPRWLMVFGAAAGFTLLVALLRYAIDLLGVVFVIILVGFAIRTLSDWLTEGEAVSAWTVSALSLGLTGTVLVGLWLFNSGTLAGNSLQDSLPGPLQRTVGWMEARGWGQRVLLPEREAASPSGSGGAPFAGARTGATDTGADGKPSGAAVAMPPPRVASEPAGSTTSRPRRSSARPARGGEATAAPRPEGPAAQPAPPPSPEAAPVPRASTTLEFSAPAASIVGRAVRLVAVVGSASDRVPTGQVVFSAGSTTLGRAPVRRGTATLVTLSLEIGDHQLGAAYEGDQWHLPSTAAPVGHSVRRQ